MGSCHGAPISVPFRRARVCLVSVSLCGEEVGEAVDMLPEATRER